jgi:hypothetical protein
MKSSSVYACLALAFFLFASVQNSEAQQYKIKQTTTVMGMKSESTVYVKGMRKRTESAGMMGMGASTTIEQCDLKRYIKINDRKKLYFIEPFSKETDEVIDEDIKTAAVKDKPVVNNKPAGKGGVITMWYSINDNGERKNINGFNARHILTSQKMKPSADACYMKDSLVMKTDGWYIDLPEFNCPVSYRANTTNPAAAQKPDCMDKYITHRSGKGKLGFPLAETRTIIMGDGSGKTTEVVTSLETIELSTVKLDSMLFTIPNGYTLASSEAELQDKFDVNDYMKTVGNQYKGNGEVKQPLNEEKKSGMTRIGVYPPKGEGIVPGLGFQQHMVNNLMTGNIEAIAVASEDDARKHNCDLVLSTDFIKMKGGGKVGGLIKAIKSADPNAASSYTIEADLVLTKLSDNSTRLQEKVSGKYDGKIDEAAKKALDDGAQKVLNNLKQ